MAVEIKKYEVDYVKDENFIFLSVTDTEKTNQLPKLVTGYKGKLLEGTMSKDLTSDELRAVNSLLLSYKRASKNLT